MVVHLGVGEELDVVGYWATVGRTLASIRPLLVALAVGGGAVALVLQALMAASARAGLPSVRAK